MDAAEFFWLVLALIVLAGGAAFLTRRRRAGVGGARPTAAAVPAAGNVVPKSTHSSPGAGGPGARQSGGATDKVDATFSATGTSSGETIRLQLRAKSPQPSPRTEGSGGGLEALDASLAQIDRKSVREAGWRRSMPTLRK